jgi:general secretion pathway protein F
MATYSVKLRNRQGQIKDIAITATSEKEAKTIISRQGKVIRVTRINRWDFSKPLSSADRQMLFTRLSSMLVSKVGTSEALRLMRDTFQGKVAQVAGKLLIQVESGGEELATAIASVGAPDFPKGVVALIEAGARSGETWKALADAAIFEQEIIATQRSSAKGMWGAIGAFIIAGITTIASTYYFGPQVLQSMGGLGGSAVQIGPINMLGKVITWIMITLMGLGGMLGFLASVGRRILPIYADKIIMLIPYYRDLVLAQRNYTTFYGLSLFVKSGVRLEEALKLAAAAAPAGALRADLLRAAQAVNDGKPWQTAMMTLHPTDRAALASALDREQISRTFDTLSRQYRELYAQRLASFVPILSLLSALFLSLAGFVLFGETILPMLQATNGVL